MKEKELEFLTQINYNNLQEEVATIGSTIASIGTNLAKVKKKLFELEKIKIPKTKAEHYLIFRGQISPKTGKAYTEGEIDAERRITDWDTTYKKEVMELNYKKDVLEATLKGLYTKANMLVETAKDNRSLDIRDTLRNI